MPIFEVNTANTISVNYRPGQDFRDFPTQSRSVFTFGDYRITRSSDYDTVQGDTSALRFDGYESMSSLNVSGFSRNVQQIFVNPRELNLKKKDPTSYAYFQTLKLDMASSLDRIISEFPYGVSSIFQGGNGVTAYEYTAVTTGNTAQYCKFKVPWSAITNPGGVILNSGSTITGRSLLLDTQDYVIQLSGSSVYQHPQHVISAYTLSAGTYLEFTLETLLFTGSSATEQTASFWIRPTDKILQDFYAKRTPLEHHLLTSGAFKHLNPQFDDGKYITTTYVWPKTIDGFNIDINNANYVNYQNNLLTLAELIDCEKTDIMMRTMIPENFLDLDSADRLYRKTIQSYAHQFDEIKRYIDGIAYAHTVEYNGENSVPDKFMFKLAELLGWKLTSGFSEMDLLEYLAGSVGTTGNAKKEYDLQLWRRIMVNLIWLFKRKGTRDALQFVFKLIGAPECMIRIDELVYDVNKAITTGSTSTLLELELSNKINERGYINYDDSPYIFQEGGKGRGNGDRYVDYWRPIFDPIPRVDNVKTQTGATVYWGTENIMNSKELVVGLDPAQAIECDLKEYYTQSGTCWVWGSGDPFQFENLNVPFEFTIEDCSLVNPESITAMTLAQWVDFIYKSNVDPRNRKISDAHNGGYHYHKLREIYIHYYRMTSPDPNQITFGKLEKFLELIEVQFYCSAEQLIPATSILEAFGTIYRNTVFNRQKFVYPAGINAGSEFQIALPASPANQLYPVQVNNAVNDIIRMSGTPVTVQSQIIAEIGLGISPVSMSVMANENLVQNQINGFDITIEIDTYEEETEIIDSGG